ncbi:helix-turn-helix domain-containing protein [Spirillospora sp. NPDC050679]
MRLVEARTAHLEPKERFDYWHELMFQSHARSLLQSDARADFQASTLLLDLGAVTVSRSICPPLRADRSASMIRQTDPETVLLHLIRAGSGTVDQGAGGRVFCDGDIVLYESSTPMRLEQYGDGLSEWLLVEIPRSVLHPLVPGYPKLRAVPFRTCRGVTAVLSHFLDALVQDAHSYDQADAAHLAGVTIDLAAAVCARQLAQALPSENATNVLLAEIRDYIDRHLGDPLLSLERIAAAHYISVRQLHKLFQCQDGPGAATWIRGLRLEHCRRDLADPCLRDVSICAIATRWGFTDPAHFARLFRRLYGLAPTDYRHASLDAE